MIRTWKCWLGAFAVCALLSRAGSAQLIEGDAFGTARVQPDPLNALRPADGAYEPIWLNDFQPPPGVGVDIVTVPQDGGVGYAVTNDIEAILYRIGRVNRHYPGLEDDGFTSAGAFIPVQVFDGNSALIAINPRAFVSDNGRGGINVGLTARRYSPQLKRVFVLSNWFDYDQAGHEGYAQYGIHAATIGQYWSFRGNINLPVGESSNVLRQTFTTEFLRDQIVVHGVGKIEMAYQQYEAEFAIPVPYFARYGFEFGLGYYYLNGADNGARDGHGVSTRMEAQVTEDLWANAQVTSDGVFGSNLSLNFELTLPNGAPSRMMRRLPVQQYLMASDRRSYRVMRDVARYESNVVAINPADGNPFRVAHIDPNGGVNGAGVNGSGVNRPFGSIFQFESLPDGVQSDYDIIMVRGRNDGSDTNLDSTITLFDGQQLLGTGIPHIIQTANRGAVLLPEQNFSTPYLTNRAAPGMDVVRLADMNVVSGLTIDAGYSANAISGVDTRGFNINRNLIRRAIVGVDIDVDSTFTGRKMVGIIDDNTIELTTEDGVRINYDQPGAVADTLELHITNNTFQGTLGAAIDINLDGSAVAELDITDNELFLLQQNQFVIGQNFLGSNSLTHDDLIPPGTMGAVGLNHIVELINARFAVYDKDTGELLTSSTGIEFWEDAGVQIPVGEEPVFPRLLYDPTANRWFAVAIDGFFTHFPGLPSTNIYVAVSESGDPTGNWSGFSFPADSIGTGPPAIGAGRFAADIRLGIDNDAIYIATNNVNQLEPPGLDVAVYTIPKNNLLALAPNIDGLTRIENLSAAAVAGYGAFLNPVVDYGNSDGGEIISIPSPANDFFLYSQVNNGGVNNGATLTPPPLTQIATPDYAPGPPAQTPGSTIPNGDLLFGASTPITSSIVKVARPDGSGDSIWAVHAVAGTGTTSALRWYEIDAATRTVRQSGLIEDANDVRGYVSPSIAVNQHGQVLIGFTQSGIDQLPSSSFVAGSTTNGVTTFSPVEISANGLGDYFPNAWGPYSSTVVDPTARNSNHFWTFQQRTIGDNDWGIQITEVISGLGGGDGIRITANDTSFLSGDISRNHIRGGSGIGLSIIANDNATVDLSGSIDDNVITNMALDGMYFRTTGDAAMNIDGARNIVTENGRNGLFMQSFDASTLNVDFRDSVFDENAERGVQGEAYNGSVLNFTLRSPFDPIFPGPASASNNGLQGVNIKGFDAAVIDVLLDNVLIDPNGDAGVSVTLAGNSVGNIDILNSTIIDTIDGSDVDFFGEGVVLRNLDNATMVALLDNNLIRGNVHNGFRALADGDSDMTLTLNNNRIINNGTEGENGDPNVGRGIVIDRRTNAFVLATLDGNTVTGNLDGGMFVTTTGSNIGGAPGVEVRAFNNVFSDNIGDGVAFTSFSQSVLFAELTNNLIERNTLNGISVTTNAASFFGAPPATPSIFDSNVIRENTLNGILLTQNDASFLHLAIVSDAFYAGNADSVTLIQQNGTVDPDTGIATGDGIHLDANGSIDTPGLTEISLRIGNAANPFPDVIIDANADDAIDLNLAGIGDVDVSVANAQLTGARRLGSPADPGVRITYTGNNDARVRIGQDMGADHIIDDLLDVRSGVDIFDFADDGIIVDYNRANNGLGGFLNFMVVNSRIGLDATRFNGGDGVEITVRDDGFTGQFYNNIIRNNGGDGIRFITLAEVYAARIISVPGDVAGPPDPPFSAQDGDANGNNIGDFPTANSPFLNADPFYINPFADRSVGAITFDATLIVGDPSQGARFGGNDISANGDDGLELSVGAGTRQFVTVRGNTLLANLVSDFRTSTATNEDLVMPASVNRAEGQADDVVLDPVAHLRLNFGDSSVAGENINIGNILLPTTTGGVFTNSDAFKGAGRAIQADFRVVVPDEVFPPADNLFTIFGVDQDESAIFLFNNYNLFGGTIQ